jgi:nucleoid-associated protein YgaU
MSKSRYVDTEILNNRNYGTFDIPSLARGFRELDLLATVKTTDYTWSAGDRMDKLSAKFYGDESYWWVIALTNNITYPFASGGLVPGNILKVPINVQDVFDQLFTR